LAALKACPKPDRSRFTEFGQNSGLSARQIDGVFNRLIRNESQAKKLIEESFLSKKFRKKYLTLLAERYRRIQG
jgi:serine/threonine-protein kinase HipA